MIQILLAAGMIALIITFVAYQMYKISRLRSHGRQIVAKVTSIRHETGKTAWGLSRDNYYVTAAWTNPRTGRTHTYWTWVMNSHPEYRQGILVPVLFDPNHPERYILDL